MPADNVDEKRRLFETEILAIASSFSPDGRVLAYATIGNDTGLDIWTVNLADGSRKPLVATPRHEQSAMFSPDGQWIAYVSNETGRNEVYVARYPSLSGKQAVSINGGSEPLWARGGRELFYREGDRMMAVPVRPGPSLTVERPRVLFSGRFRTSSFGVPAYDVTPDGKRFVMVEIGDETTPTHINVVLGWAQALQRGPQR